MISITKLHLKSAHPVLNGKAKTASARSVSRVPAADIEDTIVKSLDAHFAAKQGGSTPLARYS
jgi:hypothetical protein